MAGKVYVNPETGQRIVYDESIGDWVPAPEPQAPTVPVDSPQSRRSYGEGLAQQAGNTGLFGFMDEFEGVVNTALSSLIRGGDREDLSRRYRGYRDRAREDMAQFQEENPAASVAANVGGGLLSGLATGGAAASSALGKAGAQAFKALPFGKRVLVAAPVGGAAAAAGGAAQGAGDAPELSDIPASAAQGALEAAPVGLVGGPIAETVVSGGQKAIRALAQPFSAERRAANMAKKAIEAQGGPQLAAGRSAALGPGATLADTGDQTLALLDSLASQPGATGSAAGRQLAQRSRKQIGELTEAIGEGRAAEAIEASKKFRREQASPLYEQAFAQGVPHTDALENLFSRPSVVRAWRSAKRRGQDISGIDPDVYGDTRPSLEGWQAVKETLDDRVSALKRAGKDKEALEIQSKIIDPLLEELDDANPMYAEARRAWAGSKAFDDAIEAGKRFVREPSAATAETLEALSDVDREGYKIGAVQAIQDMLESQGWTHDATKRFRTPRMEKKLKALLGPEEFADFANRLEASRVKQATFSKVGKGSDTARREAFRADQAMAALADFGADTMTSGGVTFPLMARGAEMVRGLAGAPESARDIAGQMLLDEDIMRALRQAYAPPPPIVTQGAGLLPAFVAPAAAPAAVGLLPPRER